MAQKRRSQGASKQPQRGRVRRCRPGLEQLETRTLLSVSAFPTANGALFLGDGAADELSLRVNAARQLEYSVGSAAFIPVLGPTPVTVGPGTTIVADLGGGNDL